MAPILKEAEASAASATTTTTAATPASALSKSPNETPTRPQPVPLEIPVTVNGARTVEGSDKREPFAETSQTVLVFPHGAVIRLATPLAPGQLVFLTNEKTKKEVVCQVLKSKSGGSASGYVELQFTEPSPGFWGLRVPGTAAAPPAAPTAVHRPAASFPPAAPKVVPPTAPPVAKTSVPAPVASPVAQVPAPTKPAVVPPSAPVAPLAKVQPPPPLQVAPASSAPKAQEQPPIPVPSNVDTIPVATLPSIIPPPVPPQSAVPPTPVIPPGANPLVPPAVKSSHDFSKEIESLFAVPQAPTAAPPKPTAPVTPPPPPPASSTPSTEELKLQAARLQEQLSSMLFSGAPAAPAHPSTPPAERKPVTPVAEVANKLVEITHPQPKSDTTAETKVESKPEIRSEPKPALAVRTPIFSSLNARDEEVEIPSWLLPLSNNTATVVGEPAPAAPESSEISAETVPDVSSESESADSPSRPEAAVFGGQLLGGETAEEPAATSGSQKGLFLGLAAAAALLVGGFWYYRQNHPATSKPPVARTAAAPVAGEPVAATPSPAAMAPSRPANSTPASTPGPVNTPPTSNRNSAAASGNPSPAAAETRASNSSAERSNTPAPEPPKKSPLGKVHLATPVVKGSPGSQSASGEPLLSIDAPVENSGTDALAEASHYKGPAAPLPIGGDVKPAQLIKSVPPVYPQMAKTQRISGNVTIDALIDASGKVAEVKVISGPPLLHRAALDAVKQWKYTPAQLDGSPTAIHLTVTVQFRTQ